METYAAQQHSIDGFQRELGHLLITCTAHLNEITSLDSEVYKPSSILHEIQARCTAIRSLGKSIIATGELNDIAKKLHTLSESLEALAKQSALDSVSRLEIAGKVLNPGLDISTNLRVSDFDRAYYDFDTSTRYFGRSPDGLTTSIQEAHDRAWKSLEQIEDMARRASDIVTGMANGARDLTISNFANDFKDQAKTLTQESYIWLAVAAGCAAATFCCAWHLTNHLTSTASYQAIAENATTRILVVASKFAIVALGASATTYAARTYKSIKHNALSFSLRGRALQSMHLMIQSTKDEQTKNGIIQQVTMCIFSHQPTGLIGTETDTSMTPQMIELIRSLSSPPGKS